MIRTIVNHFKKHSKFNLEHNFTHFEYQLPDEYRVDLDLKTLCKLFRLQVQLLIANIFLRPETNLENFLKWEENLFDGEFLSCHAKKTQ